MTENIGAVKRDDGVGSHSCQVIYPPFLSQVWGEGEEGEGGRALKAGVMVDGDWGQQPPQRSTPADARRRPTVALLASAAIT